MSNSEIPTSLDEELAKLNDSGACHVKYIIKNFGASGNYELFAAPDNSSLLAVLAADENGNIGLTWEANE